MNFNDKMVSPNVMNNLINIAQKSIMQSQHGAVVLYKNQPVSYGYNYMDSYGNSIHAERHALHRFLRRYSNEVGFLNPRGKPQCILCG